MSESQGLDHKAQGSDPEAQLMPIINLNGSHVLLGELVGVKMGVLKGLRAAHSSEEPPHVKHLPRGDVRYGVQDRVLQFPDWPRRDWPLVVLDGQTGYLCLSCGTVWAHEACGTCRLVSEAVARRLSQERGSVPSDRAEARNRSQVREANFENLESESVRTLVCTCDCHNEDDDE